MSRYLFRVVFLITRLLSALSVSGQQSLSPNFKNGERVCFVGNSITQSGGYQHYIYLYHATRFPDHKVTFYNCGVGGDIAVHILKRIEGYAWHLAGDQISYLATKYNADIVDFWTPMNDINLREQKKDPKFTIGNNDRIHPGSPRHLVMAYQFLKTKNAPAYVSKMVVDLRGKNVGSVNCKITELTRKADFVSFKCLEGSLPFPVPEDARAAIALVPFQEDLNKEIIKISRLKKGMYDLFIDKTQIGSWSATDLEAG